MRFVEPSYEILHCPEGEDVLALLEQAARVCYKSEDKIHSGAMCPRDLEDHSDCDVCRGAHEEPSSYAMVRKIIGSGHHSVIEHATISVRFICNRGVTHELVRHRLASYSQESTRYCNYRKGKFGGELTIIEPSYRPALHAPEGVPATKRDVWERALRSIELAYLSLIEMGEKPQQARDILPIGLKTEIVCTANLREWRHIFALRCSPRAHPQIRELMVPLREELQRRIPLVFDDEPKPKPHKYDVAMLRALMRDGVITKADLQAALDEV
jgi:thymidylate synthase (FAD)